jgi:hypothetical protein
MADPQWHQLPRRILNFCGDFLLAHVHSFLFSRAKLEWIGLCGMGAQYIRA